MTKSLEIVRNDMLLWIRACRQEVRLDFDQIGVDFVAYAEIKRPGRAMSAIEETYECRGDLNALWPLVGLRMTRIVMDVDLFRLIFEDGTLIRCANRKDYDFVSVGDKVTGTETGYPTILHYLADK